MQSVSQKARVWVSALLLIGVVFYAGFLVGERRSGRTEAAVSLTGKETPQEVAEKTDFSPFWSVWRELDDKFVTVATTTSDQEKVWGAISGLTSSLKDPYTVFLPPEESKLFESEIAGNFEGVGMEIGIKDNMLTVIAPLKNTPAERAGIQPGDKILKIGEAVSSAMKVEQAVKLIRGPRGTPVLLTISREGEAEPFEVKIVRDVIDIPTISTEVKYSTGTTTKQATADGAAQGGVFVIQLYNFSASSPRLFRDALRTFVESGSDTLIIDLRGNPGGFLEAAVELASWFLPPGKPVVIEDFGKQEEKRVHRSRGYNIFNENLRLAILVNNGSASASEIFAGALREHGRTKLVGVKTFGKGSVQELVKITPETSLKVTVARWLTPNGISISEGGLTPDIEVKNTPEDAQNKRDPQMERAIQLLTTNDQRPDER
ncbi:MAG: Carboxy-terminal-processing protease [Parcubacteria group bacterium Greene0416_79]|nr:MAG: Carboxy-terminal-processing protease [Parcubacteria group bacterium Greene0416_79]